MTTTTETGTQVTLPRNGNQALGIGRFAAFVVGRLAHSGDRDFAAQAPGHRGVPAAAATSG